MFDLEDYGRLEESGSWRSKGGFIQLSDNEKDYIKEVLPTGSPELIVARVDELSGTYPPKAVDSNPDIVELLEPVMDSLDNRLLEAPDDFVQSEMISDSMSQIEDLDYDAWKEFSMYEKAAILQEIENRAAEIEHRPVARVEFQPLGTGLDAENGHFSPRCHPFMTQEEIAEGLSKQPVITINSDLIDNTYESYHEALDTVIHEGRHIYQECNLYEREVHSSSGDLSNWRQNEFGYKYQAYDGSFVGEKLYWMQPLESDARKFAEDVISKFDRKNE